MNERKSEVKLLIVDLDDTLWTWFDSWHASFQALLTALSSSTGFTEESLKKEIRPIHQRRGTTEYSWLLDELEPLHSAVPAGTTVWEHYDSALHAQNRARIQNLHLNPGVLETLTTLKNKGVPVVAYTESLAWWTRWRIKQTKLDGLISELYSSSDHESPENIDVSGRRMYPSDTYDLNHTEERSVPSGILKPNPAILRQILNDHGLAPTEALFVGDSLMKDVAMARRVGTHEAWAKYGSHSGDPRYRLLQDVSHWPDQLVAQEQTEQIQPTHILENGLNEVFDSFEFVAKQ